VHFGPISPLKRVAVSPWALNLSLVLQTVVDKSTMSRRLHELNKSVDKVMLSKVTLVCGCR
jgi:hypothetical protein